MHNITINFKYGMHLHICGRVNQMCWQDCNWWSDRTELCLFNWTSNMAAEGPVTEADCPGFAACVSVCTYYTIGAGHGVQFTVHIAHTTCPIIWNILTHTVRAEYTHRPLVNNITMWRLCVVQAECHTTICILLGPDSHLYCTSDSHWDLFSRATQRWIVISNRPEFFCYLKKFNYMDLPLLSILTWMQNHYIRAHYAIFLGILMPLQQCFQALHVWKISKIY